MIQTERNQLRQLFIDCWQHHQSKRPLDAAQKQILSVLLQHPEYHSLFNDCQTLINNDYTTDNNPFLHMSLHLSLQEQLSTGRPKDIKKIYDDLCTKLGDQHVAEHQIMDIMANILWDAQQNNQPPCEQLYLEKLLSLSK